MRTPAHRTWLEFPRGWERCGQMSLRLVLCLVDKKLRGQLKSHNHNAHLPPSPHLDGWHQNSPRQQETWTWTTISQACPNIKKKFQNRIIDKVVHFNIYIGEVKTKTHTQNVIVLFTGSLIKKCNLSINLYDEHISFLLFHFRGFICNFV